ncbi:hypothetical protein AB0E75_05805 [Streptomyces griseoviridis]|jgi:hypothetical protein|uniref:DUF6895 domain-containing protein n=3 Tax=Streptomyces TaxID=1883 RepID=A0ABT9LQL7_STRGD|nr:MULTISPECIES: hypothetical protein [Streptomyces]MDP9685831.1 hypothetical protein [Streptomyces griseoviridis]GGS43352.1 hypothetical protein GCM10010238_36300 [Streptomyces niveoruber]GGS77498.1 hypothetical protein GCM10010240_08180 [Streptomyces griseoviridis]GGU14898.1 hypothetical protein GCM10010259_01380 [Streptomyces daghestanicus]GHI35120.1 hypothetical protein Sdagh_68500 [Streptomyces daghestanicus]
MTSTRLTHTVGVRAMEWLWAHRDGFRLDPGVDPEIGFLERFKPIGELALICAVLFREGVAGSRQAELARKLIDHAWRDALDGGRMLVRGQRTEPISPIPFEVYLPFKELGYSQPEVERAAVLNHRLDGWCSFEVPPTRRLGLSAFQRRFGLTPRLPEDEALTATWLARTPEPWTVEGHIAYDITHVVFHVTDWGENPAGLPPRIADYLTAWLPVWIDDWLDLERWDLLGELLVVDACLPEPTLDERAWEAFAAAQAPDGAMPALRGLPEGDPDDVFDIVYHPTLVAAFASTLATSRSLARLATRSA